MKLDDLQKIENTAQPAAGMGLTLDHNGLIPPGVLAASPTADYVLTFNGTTGKQEWRAAGTAPTHLAGMGSGGQNAAVVANQAYLMPVAGVVVATAISRIFWGLNTLVAGNYDVGIYYSDDEATFTQLVSKGSTAQPAASSVISTIASTVITPASGRRWYYAIALSTASTVVAVSAGGANTLAVPGYFKAASFPLPSSLTGVTATGTTALPVLHGAV